MSTCAFCVMCIYRLPFSSSLPECVSIHDRTSEPKFADDIKMVGALMRVSAGRKMCNTEGAKLAMSASATAQSLRHRSSDFIFAQSRISTIIV